MSLNAAKLSEMIIEEMDKDGDGKVDKGEWLGAILIQGHLVNKKVIQMIL